MKTPKTFLSHPALPHFRTLLSQLFQKNDPQETASQVGEFLRESPLAMSDFPGIPKSYGRTVIHRDGNGWECLGIHWSAGAQSRIHGHPEVAYVFVVAGEFVIENFQKTAPGKVRKLDTVTAAPGSEFFNRGKAGRLDNGIHRVSCKQEGLTIHVYSANALNGELFEEIP